MFSKGLEIKERIFGNDFKNFLVVIVVAFFNNSLSSSLSHKKYFYFCQSNLTSLSI